MRYSKEEKTALLENWRKSGKSINAYVKEKGLVRWTFFRWIKEEQNSKSGFVEVPTKVISFECQRELLIEKGEIKIHVPLTINDEELRTIITVLAGVA